MIGAKFDSTKTPLQDLLARADFGSLQLPDFQRGWIWEDERIRSLLTSVSVSFPIGAVMLLYIFPEKWCSTAGIEPAIYNSVINKTELTGRTNRQIGGRAPSSYLPAVEKTAGIDAARMDEILASRCIAPESLPSDRFWDFYAARAEGLLVRIETATGKTITREPELFRAGVVSERYYEGPEEWDAEETLEEVAP